MEGSGEAAPPPVPGSPAPAPGDHYFTADPGSAEVEHTVRLVVDGRAFELVTATGVFSTQRIDPGTAVLLAHAPPPPTTGSVVDLGCGYGAIACALAIRAPAAQVLAVDVNARALELARRNAAALGLDNIIVRDASEVDDTRFDAIYSNPPIRVGKTALHELLTQWLGRLHPDGRAYLVVHRNLGSDSLARWLREAYEVERLVSVRGYRVLSIGSTGSIGSIAPASRP